MILGEFTYYPIGNGTSAAPYIKKAIEKIRSLGYKIYPGSMSTVIECETIDDIFKAVKAGEEEIISMGIGRIETVLKIDHRLDEENSVRKKLEKIGIHQ